MKTYYFNKKKYHNELQMDLGKIEETPVFDFSAEVHCTNFFEIMLFSEASGYLLLDTQKLPLRANSCLFISPFQKRRWFTNRADIKGYFLIFEHDFLNDFFSDKLFIYRMQYFFNRSVPTILTQQEHLLQLDQSLLAEILHEIEYYQKDSPHLLRSILYYLLIKLNRAFCQYHQIEADTQLTHWGYQFKAALEQHIKTKHQVAEYADLLGISRITLNQATQQQFNSTASTMIKERLVYEIKDALIFSTQTIAEIAFELQFSEPQHLIRLFKRQTGLTPKQFRTTYQNGYYSI